MNPISAFLLVYLLIGLLVALFVGKISKELHEIENTDKSDDPDFKRMAESYHQLSKMVKNPDIVIGVLTTLFWPYMVYAYIIQKIEDRKHHDCDCDEGEVR